MEVLLLHEWPAKHRKKAREDGLAALVDKYEFDADKQTPEEMEAAAKQDAEWKMMEEQDRRDDAAGFREHSQLKELDKFARHLQTLEAEGKLNPRYIHWRSDLADIEQAFFKDPQSIHHLIKAVKIKMMSKRLKLEATVKLANRLNKDHIIAIPPQVWKRAEYQRQNFESIPSPAENLVNRVGFLFMGYR